MAGLALPKLRWLVIGAVAVGIWVVREDMKTPRPPEKVQAQRSAEKPRPTQPVGVKSAGSTKTAATATPEKPVPPKPLTGKTATDKTVAGKSTGKTQPAASETVALVLPKTVDRPPSKPQKIVTGSINRPDKPGMVQTKARVHLRAQARADAAVIATLEPGTMMRELARDGDWRLVMGDGRKGWVRGDYVEASSFLKRRPKLPVAEVRPKTP